MGLNATSLRKASTNSIISQIDAGLPYRSLRALTTSSGLSEPSVAKAAGIPLRTLARRKAEGRFSPSESDSCHPNRARVRQGNHSFRRKTPLPRYAGSPRRARRSAEKRRSRIAGPKSVLVKSKTSSEGWSTESSVDSALGVSSNASMRGQRSVARVRGFSEDDGTALAIELSIATVHSR